MMNGAWSAQGAGKRGRYAIVTGVAYPKLERGAGPADKTVRANLSDREQVYRDPAISLCDHDLDAIQGAEGAPICVEHETDRGVVGRVHHSWIDDPNGKRALRVTARLDVESERGREVLRDIQAGRLRGFSVGYKNVLGSGRKVTGKTFHEISLVKEPFFDGCDLTVGVMASRQEGKKKSELHSSACPDTQSRTHIRADYE